MTAGIESQPRTVELGDRRAFSKSISQIREASHELLQGDATLKPSQGGPKTEVRSVAEGHVASDVAMDVETIGILEPTFVSVR